MSSYMGMFGYPGDDYLLGLDLDDVLEGGELAALYEPPSPAPMLPALEGRDRDDAAQEVLSGTDAADVCESAGTVDPQPSLRLDKPSMLDRLRAIDAVPERRESGDILDPRFDNIRTLSRADLDELNGRYGHERVAAEIARRVPEQLSNVRIAVGADDGTERTTGWRERSDARRIYGDLNSAHPPACDRVPH